MPDEPRDPDGEVFVPTDLDGLGPRPPHLCPPGLGGAAKLRIRLEAVQLVGRLQEDHGSILEGRDEGRQKVAVELRSVSVVGEGVGHEKEDVVADRLRRGRGGNVGGELEVIGVLQPEHGAVDDRREHQRLVILIDHVTAIREPLLLHGVEEGELPPFAAAEVESIVVVVEVGPLVPNDRVEQGA